MALIQKLKVDYSTFGEIADMAFARRGEGSSRIDVLFDVYRYVSLNQWREN